MGFKINKLEKIITAIFLLIILHSITIVVIPHVVVNDFVLADTPQHKF